MHSDIFVWLQCVQMDVSLEQWIVVVVSVFGVFFCCLPCPFQILSKHFLLDFMRVHLMMTYFAAVTWKIFTLALCIYVVGMDVCDLSHLLLSSFHFGHNSEWNAEQKSEPELAHELYDKFQWLSSYFFMLVSIITSKQFIRFSLVYHNNNKYAGTHCVALCLCICVDTLCFFFASIYFVSFFIRK